MIRKMKKLSLFVFHKDKLDLLEHLVSLGVVHPEIPIGSARNEDLETLSNEKARYVKAGKIIEQYKALVAKDKRKFILKEDINKNNIENVIKDVISYSETTDKLRAEHDALLKEFHTASPFGNYSLEKLERLEKLLECKFLFFSASKKIYESFDFEGITNIKISEDKRVYFVIVKKNDENIELPFDLINMSKKSISVLSKEIEDLEKNIADHENQIASLENALPVIKNKTNLLDQDMLYIETRDGFTKTDTTEGNIEFIKAFIPRDKEAEVKRYLDLKKIAYGIEDPNENDLIPVELKNNKYNKAFELITKVFQLPDYFELDLTPLIAVFYPIFFAFCFGDSGYGLMLTLLAIVGQVLFFRKHNMTNIGVIGITLGVITMIMGVINGGVFFGTSIVDIKNVPLFAELSKFTLITNTKENWFLTPFNAALLCGLLQIFLALILGVVNKIRYSDIADIFGAVGKLILIPSLVLWFLGDMQKMSIIKNNFFPSYYYGMIVGVIFLSILTNIGKKPDVLNSILNIYFAVTGIMGDTLSYIRLFALGASGSILGLVVNQIGGNFKDIPYIGMGVMIVFLIVGHAGNFALAMLGALVHPLRLTFVEFYNNVGFKGGGKAYRPLKRSEA